MFCLHVCLCTTYMADSCRGQKKISNSLEVEQWLVWPTPMMLRIRPGLLHWCSYILRHLSRPWVIRFWVESSLLWHLKRYCVISGFWKEMICHLKYFSLKLFPCGLSWHLLLQVFRNLVIIYLYIKLPGFILFGVCLTFWICRFMSFGKFLKFSDIIFWVLFSPFLFSISRIEMLCVILCVLSYHHSLWARTLVIKLTLLAGNETFKW